MTDQKIPNPGRRSFFTRMMKDVAAVVGELYKFAEELREGNVTPLVSQGEYQVALSKIEALEELFQQLRSALAQEQSAFEERLKSMLSQMLELSRYIYQRIELLQNSLIKVDQAELPRWQALQDRILQLAPAIKSVQDWLLKPAHVAGATAVATVTIESLYSAWLEENIYPSSKEIPQKLPNHDLGGNSLEVSPVDPATSRDKPTPPIQKPQVWIPNNPDIPEMITIPAGYFWMGSDPAMDPDARKDEQPQHRVYLSEYAISKHPVTNAQYLPFVHEMAYRSPSHWNNGNIPAGKEYHPVVNVSWDDANAYCRWLSRKEGKSYGLPTEAQWEKAARGTDGRIHPWGNEQPNSELCHFKQNFDDTTPVGSYPQGASPYGCLDMTGIVWEWTADRFDSDYYKISPERDPTGSENGAHRVLRGGFWVNNPYFMRAADRKEYDPVSRYDHVGFRLWLSASPDFL